MSESNDVPRDHDGGREVGPGGRESPPRGGGYGGVQGRDGDGVDAGRELGEISGASYGRAWSSRGDAAGDATEEGGGRSGGYRRADVTLNREIFDALARHADLDASEIDIRVQDGHVTLAGFVRDERSRRLAVDVARSCVDGRDVYDSIRIGRRPAPEPAAASDAADDPSPETELAEETPDTGLEVRREVRPIRTDP